MVAAAGGSCTACLHDFARDDGRKHERAEPLVRAEALLQVDRVVHFRRVDLPRQVARATKQAGVERPVEARRVPRGPKARDRRGRKRIQDRLRVVTKQQRRRAHADLRVVFLVLVRVQRVVHDGPRDAAGVERQHDQPRTRSVHGRPAEDGAVVERQAQERLRPVRHALHQRVHGNESERRRAHRNAVPVELQQDAETSGQLTRKEPPRLRVRDGPRGQRPLVRALHLLVKVSVPHVVDRAAGAAHDERAGAKKRQEPQVREAPGWRSERDAPKAWPQQHVRACKTR